MLFRMILVLCLFFSMMWVGVMSRLFVVIVGVVIDVEMYVVYNVRRCVWLGFMVGLVLLEMVGIGVVIWG